MHRQRQRNCGTGHLAGKVTTAAVSSGCRRQVVAGAMVGVMFFHAHMLRMRAAVRDGRWHRPAALMLARRQAGGQDQ